MQKSFVEIQKTYFNRKGGGGNFIADEMFSKLFTDINWLTQIEHPLKISIGFGLKYSTWYVPGFAVIGSHILINHRNSLNPRSVTLIPMLVFTIITLLTKYFSRKRTNDVS